MASNNIPEYLKKFGNPARLIPVSKTPEARTLGSTLATFSSVPKFAESLLSSIGVKLLHKASIECYTEITLNSKNEVSRKDRPDGLIVITSGNKKPWLALVEAKINNYPLRQEQTERYLDLAKRYNIDAVITISNQFAITPKHHPHIVDKRKIKNVGLYHWSWAYIATKAKMLVNNENISDPAQLYILSELMRFFDDAEISGIKPYPDMGASWRNVCKASWNHNTPINGKAARDCVESWHQFARANAISLGLEIGIDVAVKPQTREHRADPAKHIADDSANLKTHKTLVANLSIPGATPTIKFEAFLGSSLMIVSMRVKIPQNMGSKRSTTWLLNQLKEAIDNKYYAKVRDNSSVLAIWSEKKYIQVPLKKLLQEECNHLLIGDNKSISPKFFEIQLEKKIDPLKFINPKSFVEEAKPLLQVLYTGVGKNLMPKQKVRTLKAKTRKMSEANKSIAPATTEITIHNLGAPSGSKLNDEH